MLQDAFGGKIMVSVELSPLSPSQSSSARKGKAPWAVLQDTAQGAQRTKTPAAEGELLSHTQHFIFGSAPAMCPAKSLAGRNGVVVPNTTAWQFQPCWEPRLGLKQSWGLKKKFQREVKAGEQLAHQEQFWVKKPNPKKYFVQKKPMSNQGSILTSVKVTFKAVKLLTLPLKKQQQKSLISGKGWEEHFTFSWFLGSLQHCLINWEQDLCAIKCSGEVADAKPLHLGFESLSKVMRISVHSHLGKESPLENQK